MISIDKTYQYDDAPQGETLISIQRKPMSCDTGYPFLSLNNHGAALHHTEDGSCPDPRYNLIESPRVAREWEMFAYELPEGSIRMNSGPLMKPGETVRVREILPAPTNPEPVSSSLVGEPAIPTGFPPVVIPEGKRGVNRGFGWKSEKGEFMFASEFSHTWDFDNHADGSLNVFYIQLFDAHESPVREGKPYEAFGGDIAADMEPEVKAELEATYPPPESEWPELPDPGEGMVWERQEPTRVQSVNEGRFILLSTSGSSWREINPTPHLGLTWALRTVFRAVPSPVDPVEQATKETGEVQRWHFTGAAGMKAKESGLWVRYSDIAHLLERGGE